MRLISATELLGVIRRLPVRARGLKPLRHRTDLKGIWVNWLAEYRGPGFYRRAKPALLARSAYSQLKSTEMLAWLAAQLGVPAPTVHSVFIRAQRVENVSSSAATFRRAVPWSAIEPLLRARLGRSVISRDDLRRRIARLSAASPETDRFSSAWHHVEGGQHEGRAWYAHQKEHWLGWLDGYTGPGGYGRANWHRSAEFIFNHIVNPQMLIWLAEAVGVQRRTVRRAVRAALAKRSMASMSASIRSSIPWSTIEPLLASSGGS